MTSFSRRGENFLFIVILLGKFTILRVLLLLRVSERERDLHDKIRGKQVFLLHSRLYLKVVCEISLALVVVVACDSYFLLPLIKLERRDNVICYKLVHVYVGAYHYFLLVYRHT
jgi:hypothetical protein